ncbi:hypothetical protein L596_006945 [Steinernema carpocapsae]|uniref:Uncharacterized protein n=1 Tax=Steinernema carpocapsae TaxID=34508 RepID=A0A4U5P8Q5_STECR|nr:hypothetical protein L596_006945 [Steinernema carpocapsae]
MIYPNVLVIVQYFSRMILYTVSFVCFVRAFRRHSLRNIHKISPIIASRLVSDCVSLVCCIPDEIIYAVFMFRIAGVPGQTTKYLASTTAIMECFQFSHDIVTLGTFYIPKARQLYHCYYIDCLFGTNSEHRQLTIFIMLVSSLLNVILGGFYVIQLKNSLLPETEKKINRVIKYQFVLRCLFQTCPFLIDFVCARYFQISVSYYIGYYATLFWAGDVAALTFVYDRILQKHWNLTNFARRMMIASSIRISRSSSLSNVSNS